MLRTLLCLGLLFAAPAALAAQNAPASAPQQAQDVVLPASPLPPADNPNLTLGPDYLTFPEIAQKLSIGGHHVTCAPALKHYAAFVYLKERSWDKTCLLLSAGLQVQFRPVPKASADRVMDWEPAMRQRERAWMTRLAGNLQLYMQSRIDANAAYLSQPEALKRRHDDLQAEMDALQKKEPFDEAQYRRLQAPFLDTSAAYDAVSGDVKMRLILSLAQSSPPSAIDILDMLRAGHVFHIYPLGKIPATLFAPVQAKYYASDNTRWDYLAAGWEFSPALENLNVQPCVKMLTVKGGESSLSEIISSYSPHSGLPPMQQIFRGSGEDEAHRFDGLGKAAVAWLEAEQKRTQAALADPRLRQDVPFQPQRASGEQSRLLAAWSKRNDAEAIMTLWPQREGELGDHLQENKAALATLFDATGPFALRLNDGVLCVQNLLAFVDRERAMPVAALVQYARPLPDAKAEAVGNGAPATQPPASASEGALQFDRLLAYCKAAADASLPLMSHPADVKTYHGVDTLNLDTGIVALFLWERLPAGERESLLRQARKAYDAAYAEPVLEGFATARMGAVERSSFAARAAMQSVPISRFDTRDLEKLTHIWQAWGTHYLYPYLPEFPEQLSASQLTVSVTPQGANRPCVVWLDMKGPKGAEEAFWGCRINFLWQDK